MSLDCFFTPRSVAVIGASHVPAKLGYTIFENFVEGEFKGKFYPVNRNTNPILGHNVYHSVRKIPGPVDLAVISLPSPIVPKALRECGQKGVKGVIIISGGFSELGEEGKKLEDEIKEIRKKYGMRIIGPNCISGGSFTLIKNDDHTKHIEIGSFIDNLFEANKDKAVNVSGTYVLPSSATGKNMKILSYKDGRYQFKKILNFFKRRGAAAKVVLEGGRELICSPDHPFLVKTLQGMETKPCKDLRTGDMVPMMFGSASETHEEKISLIQEIDKKVPMEIKSKIILKNGGKKLTFDEAKTMEWADKSAIYFKWEHVSLPAMLPISEDLCKLIGFFVADGNYDSRYLSIGYTDSREEEAEVRRCVNSVFNCKVSKRALDQKIKFGRSIGKLLFEKIFEIGKYAENKNLPNFVFSLPPERIASILSGLYSGDGGISINGRKKSATLFFYTTSRKLASQVCYLFSLLGIGPVYVRKVKRSSVEFNGRKYPARDLFHIRTDSKQAIAKLAGLGFRFFDPRQNEKLLDVVENRYNFKGRIDGNTYFRKIKAIERLDGETDLYDFEVEDSHTFVADQIITHNCMGVLDLYNNIDTLFMPSYRLRRPRKGAISFISQSGAFGIATMDWAAMRNIGINKFVSFGNKVDVNETDCLEFLENDPNTKCIAMYVESIEDGKRFLEVAKRVSVKKPIVCLKAGVTEDGAKAVRSHTGSMAGSARVYSAAFRQAGVVQAEDIGELFDLVRVLSSQPLPAGNRIAIVTDGGAFGVMATDAAAKYGLKISQLPDETKARMRQLVPSHAQVENPIDLTGDASTDMYDDILHIVASEPGVDGIIAICLLQVPTISSKIVGVLTDVSRTYRKPLIACMMGGEFTDLHMRMLEEDNIPAFTTPQRAAQAMAVLVSHGRYLESLKRQ